MKISAGNFTLNADQPTATVPQALPDPDKVPSLPPLSLGSDGYLYRVSARAIEFAGPLTVSLKMPDGTNIEVSISPASDAPHLAPKGG
jgi:hypothetical protein